jgi:adenosine deaminase CECR1
VPLTARELAAERLLAARRASFLTRWGGRRADLFTQPYRQIRGRLEASRIFRSIRAMPKGGLLHIHRTAAGDAEWLVDRALSDPLCYIYWGPPSADDPRGELRFFPDGDVPGGWIRIYDLARLRPHLRVELLRLYTLGPEDEEVADVWGEFEAVFARVGWFLSYRPVFVAYYRHAFTAMAKDGIQFVEMRTSVDAVMTEDGELLQDGQVLDLYRQALAAVHERYPDFELRLIVTSSHAATLEQAAARMARTRALQAAAPDLVLGFDLVGQEDTGHPLSYYEPVLTSQPTVPLFLHAGESLSPLNTNIEGALQSGADRVGHAVNLGLFPGLEDDLRRAGVTIEACPISNQALRYVPDLRRHPAKGWLRRGTPTALASDDPGIFGSPGLSGDFTLACLAWGLRLGTLKTLALTSITAAGLPAERERRQLQLFRARWSAWIEGMLAGGTAAATPQRPGTVPAEAPCR